MKVDVILGLQWGDEGKGKIVDFLVKYYDAVVRYHGGPNAGHTIFIKGKDGKEVKHVLHVVPSGITYDHILNVVGPGVVLEPIQFVIELKELMKKFDLSLENLVISDKVKFILPTNRYLDAVDELSKGEEKVGTTLQGIGSTYSDHRLRNALRAGDIEHGDFRSKYLNLRNKHENMFKTYTHSIEDVQEKYKDTFGFNTLDEMETAFFEAIDFIMDSPVTIINTEYLFNNELKGKKVLAEGAQGSCLDVEYGTYPYVTSSNVISGGVCTGLGIPPHAIGEVIAIAKVYNTRVGGGPFPTRMNSTYEDILRKHAGEFGATTGRPRNTGWFDLVSAKYHAMINGVTQLILTKADCLSCFDKISICHSYTDKSTGKKLDEVPLYLDTITPNYIEYDWNQTETFELNASAKRVIETISKEMQLPISYLSIGPNREDIIDMTSKVPVQA